ncbi:MAG: ATP-grasp domain-containing protein [Tepidisphaeraceae bacterium]
MGESKTRWSQDELPPVLILGGEANALSVARDLSAMGVTVYAIGSPEACVRYSRHCRWIDVDIATSAEESWSSFLLGAESTDLRGAVLLPCSDAGIRVVARHREALAQLYRMDESDARAQLDVLDKLTTYQHAAAAGVPTPRFWEVAGRDEVIAIRDELVYPLVVKPRLSHVFESRFGRKHIVASSFDDVIDAFDTAAVSGISMCLVELIPGGDDHLCSYFTYVDAGGAALFDFTKRVIRRYPAGMGAASYHVTEWIPQIVAPSQALLRQVGLRGLANIEYKRDARDGTYKLIECNARFVASNCLVTASGCNLAALVYNRIVGRPHEMPSSFTYGRRLWDPMRDCLAFRELHRAGELSLFRWLRGVCHRQTFPVFRWTDPRPGIARARRMLQRTRGPREDQKPRPSC